MVDCIFIQGRVEEQLEALQEMGAMLDIVPQNAVCFFFVLFFVVVTDSQVCFFLILHEFQDFSSASSVRRAPMAEAAQKQPKSGSVLNTLAKTAAPKPGKDAAVAKKQPAAPKPAKTAAAPKPAKAAAAPKTVAVLKPPKAAMPVKPVEKEKSSSSSAMSAKREQSKSVADDGKRGEKSIHRTFA